MSDFNIMSQHQKNDLDNYITGRYGEDQHRHAPSIRDQVLRALSALPQTKQELAKRLDLAPAQVGNALRGLLHRQLATRGYIQGRWSWFRRG